MTRSGTSQSERFLKSLDPGYIKVDERDTRDLVLFAQRYSRQLKYYDADNQEDGDWFPFFSRDITAVLAGLSALPIGSFISFYRALREYLFDDPGRLPAQLSSHFKLLFHLPLELLQDVGKYYELLPRNHLLRGYLQKVITQDLDEPLKKLIAYYRGVLALADPPINDAAIFEDTPLDFADYNTALDDTDPRIQLPTLVSDRIFDSESVSNLAISPSFIEVFDPMGWAAMYAGVAADPIPYQDSIGSADQVYDQIYDALNFNLVAKTFEQLFQVLERITVEAARHFAHTIESFDEHPAHYGLWLTFLRLFQFNQGHLNALTRRHLDHYYRDVLRLCPRGAEPDRVHLLFELSKNVEEHLLSAADTLFKAGKDDLRNEAVYKLDSDIVINRARVESLKSLFMPNPKTVASTALPYAAQVTDSKDGMGVELPKNNPTWKAFGPTREMPNARIGFALADRQLFLRDGNRTIQFEVGLQTERPYEYLSRAFKVSLTTEDGWLEVTEPSKLVALVWDGKLYFWVDIDAEDPAIVPYDPAIHERSYSVDAPVMEVEFAFELGADWTEYSLAAFDSLRDVRFESLTLQTSATDIRNFSLRGDAGALDASKSFLPFGPVPKVNSQLILGSSELFSKKLETLWLYPTWEQTLTSDGFFRNGAPSTYTVGLSYLRNGTWQGAGSDVGLFGYPITVTDLDNLSAGIEQTLENPSYSTTSTAGFIRLKLRKDFGHAKYIDEKTLALIEATSTTDTGWEPDDDYNYDPATGVPLEPYSPKVTEVHLSYTAKATTPQQLFHLYPFGHKKQDTGTGRLFPELPNEGELYIGIKDLRPPQQLSMLFQTVDGSANPLKGHNTLQWHYLVGDEWEVLKNQFVDDKTKSLTGSGVVRLAVPEDANTDHRLLPDGLHWFRIAVAADADALSDLRSIDAQAASATFEDRGNDPSFVATPLAPETISKLKVAQGEVKKIMQPYASFGGRPAEADMHFATRASERLRHKDRASSMWDYERLVLENFPKVYKVKCINHTALCRDLDNEILSDNEIKPGYVLVVPIPYVHADSGVDPLRPYTDKATIVAIDTFLRARTSPFVELEVQNPRIEEVQVKFDVHFVRGVADFDFYEKQLEEAIIAFLTPWSGPDGSDISFGGKWYKSTVIDFVEELPYVDYVKDFEMYHKSDIGVAESQWLKIDQEVIQATTSRSILVSHSAHSIEAMA